MSRKVTKKKKREKKNLRRNGFSLLEFCKVDRAGVPVGKRFREEQFWGMKREIKNGDVDEKEGISDPIIKGVDYYAYCHYWESDVTKIAGWQIEKCHQDCLAGERCPYYEELEMRFN